MSADEPALLQPGVDLAQLAGLVAPLLTPQLDAEAVAQRCAAVVVDQLLPLVKRIEAAAQQERRSIGPFVPPPATTPN